MASLASSSAQASSAWPSRVGRPACSAASLVNLSASSGVYRPRKLCSRRLPISVGARRLRCLSGSASAGSSVDPDDSSGSTSEAAEFNLNLPRRRMLAEFTCNECNVRTQRIINPLAYKRGTVFVQCSGCEVYHQLVDNLGLIVEYKFEDVSEEPS